MKATLHILALVASLSLFAGPAFAGTQNPINHYFATKLGLSVLSMVKPSIEQGMQQEIDESVQEFREAFRVYEQAAATPYSLRATPELTSNGINLKFFYRF